MISFVEGKCVYAGKDKVVLEVGGLGYEISVTESFAASCAIDRQYRLQTVMIVRENEISLVGFSRALEREMFKLLTAISGIGPKLAMKILSDLSPADIASCVLDNNFEVLKGVSGVGLKTAKRLILELQGKISAMASELALPEGGQVPAGRRKTEDKAEEGALSGKIQLEAKALLVSLGCGDDEAEAAIKAALSRFEPGQEPESSDKLVMAAMGELGGI